MEKKRLHLLDEIRGITLISMILFHTMWDLVFIFGVKCDWYLSYASYIWQQSICYAFILLSGFCFSLGKKKYRRGAIVFAAGFIISIATELFMPQNHVRFGVLTLLGSCMLLFALVEKIMEKIPAWLGFVISVLLFILTRGVGDGYLGFESMELVALPKVFYEQGEIMTYLGFPYRGFYSTDYFPLLPWVFLFGAGYFLYQIFKKNQWLTICEKGLPFGKPFRFMGKYSLIIYMLHQPVVYGILWIIF